MSLWTINIVGHNNQTQTASFLTLAKARAFYDTVRDGMVKAKAGENPIVECQLENEGGVCAVDCDGILGVMFSAADPVLSATLTFRSEQLNERAGKALEKFRALAKTN